MYNKVHHLPIKIKTILISWGFFFTYPVEANAKFYYNSINFVKLPNKKYKVKTLLLLLALYLSNFIYLTFLLEYNCSTMVC